MQKPQPVATPETQPFWDACNRRELVYQRCRGCGAVQFYPRAHCARCHTTDLAWETASGQGTIYSFTVVHRAPTAAFKPEVPYILALVDMAEGFRMMVNLPGTPPEQVAIGQPIRIVFQPTESGQLLPQAELRR